MKGNGSPGGRARTWPYVVAGVIFAGIIGWISYTDALAVTTLAGNGGGIAYAYPVIPDGLLYFSLLAAWEAARAGVPRSRWAVAGFVLGAAMTLAANTGAGLQRSVLDAVIDFLIPLCFFVAVEIVLWHVKRGRGEHSLVVPALPAQTPSLSVPVSVPLPSVREIRERRNCSQATAVKIRAELRLLTKPPAAAAGEGARNTRKVSTPGAAPAAGTPRAAGAPDRGRGGPLGDAGAVAVPATMNGSGPHA